MSTTFTSLLAWSATAAAIAVGVATRSDAGQSPPASSPASAASTLEDAAKRIRTINIDVDLAVPDSPAFTALGLSPETIVRPTTPRQFATALLNGVDAEGHLQTGVAIDTVPFLVFGGDHVTLADYRRSHATQILSRTSLSFATTRGATSDDPSVKLALGLHATLYDSEDPRLNDDLLRCYSEIPPFPVSVLPLNEEAQQALELEKQNFVEKTVKPAAESCQRRFKLPKRWNSTSWIVAVAPSWTSPTGAAKDIDSGTVGVWSSLSYGFDSVPGLRDNAQLIAHVRYLANEVIVNKALPGGSEKRDTTLAGARLRGGTNTFGFSFEAAYLRTSAAGRRSDTGARLAVGIERRLAENLWFTASFGGDRGMDQTSTRGLSLLSSVKWAFAKNPALTPDQFSAPGPR